MELIKLFLEKVFDNIFIDKSMHAIEREMSERARII